MEPGSKSSTAPLPGWPWEPASRNTSSSFPQPTSPTASNTNNAVAITGNISAFFNIRRLHNYFYDSINNTMCVLACQIVFSATVFSALLL